MFSHRLRGKNISDVSIILCNPERHIYWVNRVSGDIAGSDGWMYFLIKLFSGQGGQLAGELLRCSGERELHGQVWWWYWSDIIKCQAPDTDHYYSASISSVLFCLQDCNTQKRLAPIESYNLFRFMFHRNKSHSPWTLIYWHKGNFIIFATISNLRNCPQPRALLNKLFT